MKDVKSADLELFVDNYFNVMYRYPDMYGTPEAIEGICFTLIDTYMTFCLEPAVKLDMGLDGPFQTYSRERLPKRPSPQCLAEYFREEYREKTKAQPPEDAMRTREAENYSCSCHIIQFFMAWKEKLSLPADES